MSVSEVFFGGLMVAFGLKRISSALGELQSGLRGQPSDVHKRTGKYALRPCPGDGKSGLHCKLTEGGSIERRANILLERIRQGSLDPRVRRMAVRALSERCDGDYWCVPPKDALAEITKLWNDYNRSDTELAKAIRQMEGLFAFTRKNARYTSDHREVDTFQTPYRTLADFHAGDCDDAAVALGSLCRAVGYEVGIRVYQTKKSPEPDHVAAIVNLDKRGGRKLMVLDPTVDRVRLNGRESAVYPGWGAPNSMLKGFKDYWLR